MTRVQCRWSDLSVLSSMGANRSMYSLWFGSHLLQYIVLCTGKGKVLLQQVIHYMPLQALKANPSLAPKEVKISSNYITKFGQVALMEALDMVYEMGDQREIVIHF